MKKIISVFLSIVLVVVSCSVVAFSVDEKPNLENFVLPKPQTPNYMMFEDNDTVDNVDSSDSLSIISMVDQSVISLSSEYYADSEAFYEKYGLYSFSFVMQFDSSLDDIQSWKYTSEWDTYYGGPSTGSAAGIIWLDDESFDSITLFDLYNCDYGEYTDLSTAVTKKEHFDGSYDINTYHFNEESHSLNIRCRYYMEWQTYDGENIGETQSKFSEWSDIAVFGRNGTAVIPQEPIGYEAPSVSDLTYFPAMGNSNAYFEYMQTTPASVWEAGIYYKMTSEGSFEGLETQISVNGGVWQEYYTYDSWGDWCLSNGKRTCGNEDISINEGDNIKLRIRFNGTHGSSPWSNVAEIVAGEDHKHSLTHTAAKNPTCCEIGNVEFWHCSECGKFFSDAAATNEITETTILATRNHTANGWSKNEEGHWHECTVGSIIYDFAIHIPGAAATDTQPQVCTVCGYVIEQATGGTVITSATVSGTVKTGDDKIDNDDYTIITFTKQGQTSPTRTIVLSGSGSQTYTAEALPVGTYKVVLSKINHVQREYTVVADEENVKRDFQICLKGDIDMNGTIGMPDLAKLNSYLSGLISLDDYATKCADVTGDTRTGMPDLAKLNSYLCGLGSLWS